MKAIDKPKLKLIANGGTVFSTVAGIVSFYIVPTSITSIIIVTISILLISLGSALYKYVNEVNTYLDFQDKQIEKKSNLIDTQQTEINNLSQKHKALSEQFTKKSEKLDNATNYFNYLSTFIIQALSFTSPPYTKKQENERYQNLLNLIIEFSNKSKEE